ncbi:HypC/HybG/HupF family hydrogenase formation chaperone [soil metagenome]
MCLGIPGQLVELSVDNDQLARVDVAGVRRMINIGLREDEVLQAGDWVLIHVGFAMSKIDEAEAEVALASLKLMGSGLDDEMEMIRGTAP